MQMLIRRYVTSEQKKMEDFSITEDDIAEVRHDISTMRFEILDIFRKNGYKVGKMPADESVGKQHIIVVVVVTILLRNVIFSYLRNLYVK